MTADGPEARPVGHEISGWSDGTDGKEALNDQIAFCRGHTEASAHGLGCFAQDDRLVGLGLMRPELEPGVAQLAYLAASRPYRRHGVGQALLDRLPAWATEP
jgi:ribosomal protein S18 acetylase RimI-like enzyme